MRTLSSQPPVPQPGPLQSTADTRGGITAAPPRQCALAGRGGIPHGLRDTENSPYNPEANSYPTKKFRVAGGTAGPGSFFSTLKRELGEPFDSSGEGKMELSHYIEMSYNQPPPLDIGT